MLEMRFFLKSYTLFTAIISWNICTKHRSWLQWNLNIYISSDDVVQIIRDIKKNTKKNSKYSRKKKKMKKNDKSKKRESNPPTDCTNVILTLVFIHKD